MEDYCSLLQQYLFSAKDNLPKELLLAKNGWLVNPTLRKSCQNWKHVLHGRGGNTGLLEFITFV
jgi:hypothetical protein